MSATVEDEQINLRATSGRGNLNRAVWTTTTTTTGTTVGQEKTPKPAYAPLRIDCRIRSKFFKKRGNQVHNSSKIATLPGTVIGEMPALLGATAARATVGKTLTAGISPRTVCGQRRCASGLVPDPGNGEIKKTSGDGAVIIFDDIDVASKITAGGDDDTIVDFAPVAVLDQHQRSGGMSCESLAALLTNGCGDQTVFTASEQCIATQGTVDVDGCNQTMKEKGGVKQSLIRPSTAVPTRSSLKRPSSRPFSSRKVTHKNRPNDKDRMDRRAARRKKYRSLVTSKAAVRVYRSIGKKREPVGKSGGWR